MRVEKKCACGGEIVVVYAAPRSEYDLANTADQDTALKELHAWDVLHRDHVPNPAGLPVDPRRGPGE